MKNKKLFLIAPLCGVALLTSGCSTCPTGTHKRHDDAVYMKHQNKHKKHAQPPVFHQNYGPKDIDKVRAKMFTRSAKGNDTDMGFIQFQETDNGLQMNVDLVYLRPGKIYTAQIYQCGACNDSTCCDISPMNVDLPQIIVQESGDRLQQTYIIRGLTATQLNNAKLVLTRDGGHKAAWGKLKQK